MSILPRDVSKSLSSSSESRRWRTRDQADNFPVITTDASRSRQPISCGCWMPFFGAITLVALFSGVVYIPTHRKWPSHNTALSMEAVLDSFPDLETTNASTSAHAPMKGDFAVPNPDSTWEVAAHQSILQLYARQSRTLEQASARYSLKTGRETPPNYDKWFRFAKDSQCLIDEYDRIYRDLAPFYELARDHPGHFRAMIESGRNMTLLDPRGIISVRIRNGKVQFPIYEDTQFDEDLKTIIQHFADILPETDFLLNGRDEPRVVFDVRAIGAKEEAVHLTDPDPFRIAPVSSAEFFRKHGGCNALSMASGFSTDATQDVAFLSSSSNSDFTTDLWPLLSTAKTSPCFSDILFPGVYYYNKVSWTEKLTDSNHVPWENKTSVLYWRGASTGGHIYTHTDFPRFPRFRLMDLARTHPEFIDARLTALDEVQCTPEEGCDADAISVEYEIATAPAETHENGYKFKFVLDVDGNASSGEFLALLRSGSLVFRSTAFEEYFSDWLLPYEHYIPVRPDLSDLIEKIEWARKHDEEARVIQARGMQYADRVLTDRQNDCYFAAVLLEWARLMDVNGTANATVTVGQGNGTALKSAIAMATETVSFRL